MSRRQDYIARIRYRNELPPPPCAPKLLKVGIDAKKMASASLLSGLIRKQPFNVDVDANLGMPLDITKIPGIFDRGDESGVYPYPTQPELDPKDRALLRDPIGPSGISKTQPGVSFLRRTEYISSEALRQSLASTKRDILKKKTSALKELDPATRLKAVEATFDTASSDLSKLTHPKKKGVTAVASYPLLPDFKNLDLQYVSVKMVGSASLRNSKRKFTPEELDTSIFARHAVGPDEWMSLYTAENIATAEKFKEKENSLTEALDEDDTYTFTRIQDNDVDFTLHSSNYDEVAISFNDEDKKAIYVPIWGRANLKRRRFAKEKQDLIEEHTVDKLQLSLRDLTQEEVTLRDNERSVYDPVDYTYSKIDDESEGSEQEVVEVAESRESDPETE